jgi:hypothetical protein
MKTSNVLTTEKLNSTRETLLCWKSVLGGVFISILGYMILTFLGTGIGGSVASTAISSGDFGSGIGTGAALWIGISAAISLYLGSYFAVRTSRFVTNRIGAAHGFVVSALFFILMIWGAGNVLGSLTIGFGEMIGSFGRGVARVSANPAVQDTIERALNSSKTLRDNPDVVIQGLATRLLQGDAESTKSYFAYETGLSPSEVDTTVASLKNDFDQTVKNLGEKAANTVADTGWSLFGILVVGTLAAMLGARLGAHANGERPLFTEVETHYPAMAGV